MCIRDKPRPGPRRGRRDPDGEVAAMISDLAGMLGDPLMQRALVVACLVGLVAPVIGTYLVQRRLSLLGDGIGHVALPGVALGWLVGNLTNLVPKDALAIPDDRGQHRAGDGE